MKKLTFLFIAILLAFSFSITASAEEAQYEDSHELYSFWVYYGYPDYVCGVWSTYGTLDHLTIGIQDTKAGNAGKQKILDLIEDDSSVAFTYQKYSLNYLEEIRESLWKYTDGPSSGWLAGYGIDVMENVLRIMIFEEKVHDHDVRKIIRELSYKYGDAIAFEVSSGLDLSSSNISGESTSMTGDELLLRTTPITTYIILFAVVIFLVAVFILFRKRGIAFLRTNKGTTVSSYPSISTKDVEKMVTDSQISVSSDLDEKVMASINKKTSS